MLAGIPAMMGAFLSFIGVLLVIQVQKRQVDTHSQLNSRLDQMLLMVEQKAKAEGVLEERERHTKK